MVVIDSVIKKKHMQVINELTSHSITSKFEYLFLKQKDREFRFTQHKKEVKYIYITFNTLRLLVIH